MIRQAVQIDTVSIDVGRRSVDAELYTPDGDGPFSSILLLHELFGLTSHVRADARHLCREGYQVLAPNLYTGGAGRYCVKMLFTPAALQNRDDLEPTREVSRCLDYVKALPSSNGKLGMIGMCLSGGFVLQMARRDDMAAPVVFHYSFGQRGSGMPAADAADVKHTILGNFADPDRLCPRDRVMQLKAQLGDKLDEKFFTGAGHGLRSAFRHTGPGAESWDRTLAFFAQHL